MVGVVSFWELGLLLCIRQICCNLIVLFMNSQQSRVWRVLCWNVRGLNGDARHRALRSKIEESQATIVCIQETKCEYIDHKLLRKFCPKRFDNFAYIPSKGASGGLLVLWCSSVFLGRVIQIADAGIMVDFTSVHNGQSWTLVTVYGPCQDRKSVV